MPLAVPPGPTASDRDVRRYIDRIERRLLRFDRAIALADWALYTGRSRVGPERIQLARARFLDSDALLRFARSARNRSRAARLDRELELLEREALDARVEQAPSVVRPRGRLQRRIVAFRPRWRGRRVNRAVIYDVLRVDPDRAVRRRAFGAEDPLRRAIEADLSALVVERNERARALGFDSFPAMRLGFEGLTPLSLARLIDRALSSAPPRLRAFREESIGRLDLDGWAPWDLLYARERRASLPDRAFPGRTMARDVASALRGWGFAGERLRFRLTRHDLPFGGLTIVPEVPHDVRVLVHPRGGWEYYLVLLHEFGHAVHAASIRAPSHLLRSTYTGFAGYLEGIADVFEEIAFDERWLGTRPGLDGGEVQRFRRGRSRESLLRAVSVALSVQLELDLYRHPGRDPGPAHRTRVCRWFGYDEYPAMSTADPFFVTHPVYVQSYFLSLLFRKQIVQAMPRARGGELWPNRRAGPWLAARWFRFGSEFDWMERVREVTGHPFAATAFAQSVRRGEP